MVATSPCDGARSESRAVLSAGTRRVLVSGLVSGLASTLASRAKTSVNSDVATSVANVIAWAPEKPTKTERGDRHAGLPFWSPFGSAGSTACRRTSYDPPYYWAAAPFIGCTDTKTRPLVLVTNSTLPLIRAKSVWSLPTPTLRPACHLVPR